MLFCVSGGSFFGVSKKVKGFACRKNSRVGGGKLKFKKWLSHSNFEILKKSQWADYVSSDSIT